MRNAQKTALMALFAAMEDTDRDEPKARADLKDAPGPRPERPIAVDPIWLAMRQIKGRA